MQCKTINKILEIWQADSILHTDALLPETENGIWQGKRNSEGITKDKDFTMEWLSWIIWAGPVCVPIKHVRTFKSGVREMWWRDKPERFWAHKRFDAPLLVLTHTRTLCKGQRRLPGAGKSQVAVRKDACPPQQQYWKGIWQHSILLKTTCPTKDL
jgi:hypothetical protein